MFLKVSSLLMLIIGFAYCQYDVQQVIDQTQFLQQIEKYGTNLSHHAKDNYQQVQNPAYGFNLKNNEVYSGNLIHENNTQPKNNNSNSNYPINNYPDHHGSSISIPSYNLTERFLNKTISNMPKGVCVQEVPTVSLLKKNDVVVAGNGTDSSLSRIQICCEGYKRNEHNFRKCDPVCHEQCINGICVSPDKCECYPDHVRNFGGFCLPTCPIGCGNGECMADNTCSCKPGFTLEPYGKFCVPKCSSGCNNGNCTAPDTCECYKGYSFSSFSKKCEPVCSGGCSNGDCLSPEVCNCLPGFAKENGVCMPVCSNGCLNGMCVGPEKCECPKGGWELDISGTKCFASCDQSCLNGMCSGPNICSCRQGYVLDNVDPFKCIPHCDHPCVNGICSGPNFCICHAGFVKDRALKGSQSCIRQ